MRCLVCVGWGLRRVPVAHKVSISLFRGPRQVEGGPRWFSLYLFPLFFFCPLLVIAVQVKEETIDPSEAEFETTELPVPISSIKQEDTD